MSELPQGVQVLGGAVERGDEILTKEALEFVAGLQRAFGARRDELLERRKQRREEAAKKGRLDFLEETKHIRENDAWKGAPPAPGLVDRRVEITGPTDRKMVVNALNSNVWTYMADFEGTQSITYKGKNTMANLDQTHPHPHGTT